MGGPGGGGAGAPGGGRGGGGRAGGMAANWWLSSQRKHFVKTPGELRAALGQVHAGLEPREVFDRKLTYTERAQPLASPSRALSTPPPPPRCPRASPLLPTPSPLLEPCPHLLSFSDHPPFKHTVGCPATIHPRGRPAACCEAPLPRDLLSKARSLTFGGGGSDPPRGTWAGAAAAGLVDGYRLLPTLLPQELFRGLLGAQGTCKPPP